MQSTLVAAGFIAASDVMIYATGTTQDEALTRARTTTSIHPDQLNVIPATEKLIAQVKAEGGEIGFPVIRGVACTLQEADDLLDHDLQA